MQTPYEILQLKQKQKRKIISQLKRQRSFSFKFNKDGLNPTKKSNEKPKPSTQHRYRKSSKQTHGNQKPSNSEKKYEIIFRESIRKVNSYRTKVYHTHNSFRNEYFVHRFMTTQQQKDSPKHRNFIQNNSTFTANKSPSSKIKTCNPEKQCEFSNTRRFCIFFTSNQQKNSHNQIVPEISVQKCKLNPTENENKERIQKMVHSLYSPNKKQEKIMRRKYFDSFTERDNFSQETQRKLKNPNYFQTIYQPDNNQKNPQSAIAIKREIKLLKHGQSFNQFFNPTFETMDETKVANFIKSKKKKRLPISTIRSSKANEDQYSQFKRTITDCISNNRNNQDGLKNTQQRYFSPNKNSRCGARIKFNTIEENISGWEVQPQENGHINHQTKSPLLQY